MPPFPGFLPPSVINATFRPPEKCKGTLGARSGWLGRCARGDERQRRGAERATTGTIASEGVIPLSVFVNFVSCISRHYPPYRAAALPRNPRHVPHGAEYEVATTTRMTRTTTTEVAAVAAAWSVMLPPIGRVDGLSGLRNGQESSGNIFHRASTPAIMPSSIKIFAATADVNTGKISYAFRSKIALL